MEMVLELAMTFWQWVILGVLVIAGWVCTHFDGQGDERIGFKYSTMPKMSPLPIETASKGFWKGVWL